jgi:hypothetical protein
MSAMARQEVTKLFTCQFLTWGDRVTYISGLDGARHEEEKKGIESLKISTDTTCLSSG